jgi:hypothetical protein
MCLVNIVTRIVVGACSFLSASATLALPFNCLTYLLSVVVEFLIGYSPPLAIRTFQGFTAQEITKGYSNGLLEGSWSGIG